jgi:carbamoyl-phosphate synthase large subunit
VRNRFQSQRRSPEHRRLIKQSEISLTINTPLGKISHYDEQAIRKAALQFNVPCVTTITGADALIEAIATKKSQKKIIVRSLQEIHHHKQLTADERI